MMTLLLTLALAQTSQVKICDTTVAPARCATVDNTGALKTSGGGSGGGNAAAGPTGAAVPTSADYTGYNSSGNLVGVSSANPLPVTQTGTATVSGTVTATQGTGSNLHVVVDTAPTTAVTGTFFQATQPVSGSVTATQATGSNLHVVVDTAPTTAVTGTFFQTTQPVSATSLPLPSNAAQETGGNLATIATNTGNDATSANQTNGNQKTQVTNFPATQPVSGSVTVSGTVTANQGGAPWSDDVTDRSARLLGHVTVDTAPTTAITAASLPLPTNAAQEAGGNLAAIAASDAATATAQRNLYISPLTHALKVDGSATVQPVIDANALAQLVLLVAAQNTTTATLVNGTTTVQVATAPPPLNPLLQRCNAVRRSNCQP